MVGCSGSSRSAGGRGNGIAETPEFRPRKQDLESGNSVAACLRRRPETVRDVCPSAGRARCTGGAERAVGPLGRDSATKFLHGAIGNLCCLPWSVARRRPVYGPSLRRAATVPPELRATADNLGVGRQPFGEAPGRETIRHRGRDAPGMRSGPVRGSRQTSPSPASRSWRHWRRGSPGRICSGAARCSARRRLHRDTVRVPLAGRPPKGGPSRASLRGRGSRAVRAGRARPTPIQRAPAGLRTLAGAHALPVSRRTRRNCRTAASSACSPERSGGFGKLLRQRGPGGLIQVGFQHRRVDVALAADGRGVAQARRTRP